MTLRIPMAARHLSAIVAFCVMSANVAETQTLPASTGPFGVGRVTFHWIDKSRSEPLSEADRSRELMVDIWYPADKTNVATTDYLGNFSAYEEALGPKRLQAELRGAYDAVKAGSVRTHTVEGRPFARSLKRVPILIFSPGGGMLSRLYTAQLEDFASHGYVVASVTHTYDVALTIFPDGRRIPYTRAQFIAPGTPEEQSIAYANTRMEWSAADIRFVLDELQRQDRMGRSPSRPFAEHLDFGRVGAFGHSAGGRAAARACQLDARIRACLNQDGVAAMQPFYLSNGGWGMDQPFLLFLRRPAGAMSPSDEELDRMGLTRAALEKMIAERTARQQEVLQNTGGGSYLVLLDFNRTTHISFSDLPVLGAHGRNEAARVLETVRNYTRAFFEKTLSGKRDSLLDKQNSDDVIAQIVRFPPAARPISNTGPMTWPVYPPLP
jgi:predicted dienelactone hydrolase